jgi:hypothetical protein
LKNINETFAIVIPQKLLNLFCDKLCYANGPTSIDRVIRNLDEGKIWEGEMVGQRIDGETLYH